MPRNASGTYTLPIGAFSPNTLIKSSDHNSNYSDIATALTQSLATTGVTAMTGQLKAFAGTTSAPGYAFATDLTTGLYLAGTHQLGIATNGTQVVTFNSDQSVTWAGAATWGSTATFNGALVTAGNVTLNSTTFTFGSGAAAAFWAGIAANVGIEFGIDGGGSTIQTGAKGWIEVPFNCTIQRATMLADQSGSLVVDVLTSSYASYNPASSFSSITGGNPPTISSALKYQDSTLTGWSKTLTAGTIIEFNVTGSPATITKVTVSLLVQRTGS